MSRKPWAGRGKENCAPRLLSRAAFKEAAFARDKGRCVVCGAPCVDAHHLLDRKLWPDGGYYIDNAASLCSAHHLDAERCAISVERLRELCGIQRVVLPPGMDPAVSWDKWGARAG